jgi:autotransporter-associated beta strand protein
LGRKISVRCALLSPPVVGVQRTALAIALAALAAAAAPARAQIQRALGLDVSYWQGSISQATWNNIRNVENRQFVFIRSSRGGTTGYYDQNNSDNDPPTNTFSQRYDDPAFIQNITRATTAGMYAGPYHFSRPDVVAGTLNSGGIANTGADEADHFIQMAGPWMRPGYLVPVHDFEAGDGIRSDNEMAQFSIDFSNRIYDVMGIRPAIYTNGNYAFNILSGASSSLRNELAQPAANPPSLASPAYPVLWSARWPNQSNPNAIDVQNGNPTIGFSNIYGPWDDYGVTHPWAFWQYASTGRLQSFNNGGSNLDFDVAHGGVEFLKDNLVPAVWMNDSSGDWSTLANWNSGQTPVAPVPGRGQVARLGPLTLPTPRLPGAAGSGVTSGQHDTVILDRPDANITVTLSTGTHNVRKLYAREALDITGGTLTINYVPSPDSTPISARFSAPVSLTGDGSLSVHTLQVDASQTFTAGGDGTLSFDRIKLMPHGATPATLLLAGDLNFAPLAGAAAAIGNGSGVGLSGRVDLGGAVRMLDVADGDAAIDLTISTPITNGGLVKQGPGVLALTGANSYEGDTAVAAGLLRIASPFLPNAADVHLASGATLDLNFTGADVIDSLFVDGVSQAEGLWGAEGSGAPNTSPLLVGSGMLEVSTFIPPPSPADFNGDGLVDAVDLEAWYANYGMSGDATPEHGDADGNQAVDGADFLAWQRALSGAAESPPAAGKVPEPSTGLLLLAGVAALTLTHGRRGGPGTPPRRRRETTAAQIRSSSLASSATCARHRFP